jgi:hypothetical protein
MATADALAHFGGPDVLDPLFQRMRACGLASHEAQGRILEALKYEKLVIMAHVAAGAWSLQSREYATREEEVRARQEGLAALERFDRGAYYAIVYEQSPSPDGIIGPIETESWGDTVRIAIRDGHLVIELLDPRFPPESYSFVIANPEGVDKLLAAAFPAHASSVTPTAVVEESRKLDATKRVPRLKQLHLTGRWQKQFAAWARLQYPSDGDIPETLSAAEMADLFQPWEKREAEKTERKPPKRNAKDLETLQRRCREFLSKYRDDKPAH